MENSSCKNLSNLSAIYNRTYDFIDLDYSVKVQN